jgi:probable phosphoglycerate mutase
VSSSKLSGAHTMESKKAAPYPEWLWLIRHAESAGNVARDRAELQGLSTIEIEGRDVDVPLSERGRHQAQAVGRWFATQPPAERFDVVLTSPYVRAKHTAEAIVRSAQAEGARLMVDERLREKEFGSLNRLTKLGIVAQFPAEAERRAAIGKFYYRPPGGESWCDVILRLRSLFDHIQLRYAGKRVLLVTHQVVVLCFRYLLEELDEAAVLAIDQVDDVANCSITSFQRATASDGEERLLLRRYNYVEPVENAGAPVTHQPDPTGTK